jgi:hypothetical protein
LFTAASSSFTNPIFRSGEDCRHFNFNSYTGISVRSRKIIQSKRHSRYSSTCKYNRDKKVIGFRQSIEPLRATFKIQVFLGGEMPNYADYIVFGAFIWARSTSPFKLLEKDDPITLWRDRMLDRFEFARMAPGYDP